MDIEPLNKYDTYVRKQGRLGNVRTLRCMTIVAFVAPEALQLSCIIKEHKRDGYPIRIKLATTSSYEPVFHALLVFFCLLAQLILNLLGPVQKWRHSFQKRTYSQIQTGIFKKYEGWRDDVPFRIGCCTGQFIGTLKMQTNG